MHRTTCGFALLALFLCLGAAAAASAAEAPPSVGVVDLAQIRAEYEGLRQLNQQFQDFQAEQQQQLEQQHKARLLSDEERQEFLDRVEMSAPTPEAQQRLDELAQLSGQREARLKELRGKEERTEEEEAEYQRLNALYSKRMEELAAAQAAAEDSVVEKYDELNALYVESINAAVKAVAEEQGLALVLERESVLFGGADVTEAVLEKLSAEKPE